MREFILLAAASVLALAAGSAAAKTVTVTITKNGYVPSATSIAQGDTVQFTNADTVVHQIEFKSTAGVTCAPSPLVIQPTASGSCTFNIGGSYSYSDPNVKGHVFRGTVTVTATPASLSIAVNRPLVVYGGSSVLSGTLSTQKVGEKVDVLAQQCGASPSKVTTVLTTAGGVYTAAVSPLKNTAYTAKNNAVTSAAVTVRVRPRLRLVKIAAHRFLLRVTAGSSLAGKYASFQRYNGTLKRWVAVRTVLLKASSVGIAPSVVTAASFRTSIRSRLRVRATLAQAQIGSCYAPGTSNVISS